MKKCGVGRRFAYTRMLIFHVTQDVINEYINVPGVGCRQNRSFFVFIKLAWAQVITATAQPVGIVDRKIKSEADGEVFGFICTFGVRNINE